MITTARQLKDLVRNLSKKKSADAQILMRNYMMERFLERISLSEYKNQFILKGGMLVAAMVGLDARATMDLDATIKGTNVSVEDVEMIISKIISIPLNDGVLFRIKRISEIMEEADYPGVRVSMETKFDGVITPLKIDISTGDIITPREIKYNFNLMLENRTIEVWAYNLETVLAEKLELWETALPESIKLAYLPKLGIIRLRLTGRGQDKKEVRALLDSEKAKLEKILGEDIFCEEDTPLEVIIGELLKKKKITVSTAESCTGGSIAARLTSIAGSSEYFKGSIVAYSNEVKMNLLYVSPETLERHGAVSEETVIEMVKGAMKALKTDCAVATSGIAGPGGGTPEKPVGTVWIAAGYKNEIRTYKQETNRGRAMNIERAGNNALLILRDLLK